MSWTLSDVSVSYRLDDGARVEALLHVSAAIQSGEHLAVIGRNGSGKSTLAKVLSGIIAPSGGTIQCNGHAPRDDEFGALVLQDPADNIIGATIREEIELTLGTVQRSERIAQADTLLRRFGIAHLLDRPSDTLSGGETQLAALICGILSGRTLVVLDEPSSHLDPPSRETLISRLVLASVDDDATWPSAAIVFVTQYPEEARQFPRVIELDRGRIRYDGAPQEWNGSSSSVRAIGWSPRPSGNPATILVSTNLSQRPESPSSNANLLTDISVQVKRGDAIGLAGPIGSGKTTLAYHLSGLVKSPEGSVKFTPGVSGDAQPVVLIQFSDRQLFAESTLEDVAFGPRNQGLSDGEATGIAEDRLEKVGLPANQFGLRSPFSLSGGQKRRVALAGIAACRTPLFILDEPTSALDVEGITCLEEHLREWNERGIAYIVISHDIPWLEEVTSRIWIMNEGRLLADTTWIDPACGEALRAIGFSADSLPNRPEKQLDLTRGET